MSINLRITKTTEKCCLKKLKKHKKKKGTEKKSNKIYEVKGEKRVMKEEKHVKKTDWGRREARDAKRLKL